MVIIQRGKHTAVILKIYVNLSAPKQNFVLLICRRGPNGEILITADVPCGLSLRGKMGGPS